MVVDIGYPTQNIGMFKFKILKRSSRKVEHVRENVQNVLIKLQLSCK